MKFLRKFMKDQTIEKKYIRAGAQFGDAVSYLYMGECVGFESMLNIWTEWEQEYINRGYRTVSLDDFIEFGGYGKSIDHLLGQKLEENEEPVFHAQIYRSDYLGKVKPKINLNKNTQFGTYIPPSTKQKPSTKITKIK